MPASSQKQANYMRMAAAMKAGHTIEGISAETRASLHKTARSMSKDQLKDFAHVATRPKAKR